MALWHSAAEFNQAEVILWFCLFYCAVVSNYVIIYRRDTSIKCVDRQMVSAVARRFKDFAVNIRSPLEKIDFIWIDEDKKQKTFFNEKFLKRLRSLAFPELLPSHLGIKQAKQTGIVGCFIAVITSV